MVQFKGININAVSQIDAKRLPEHSAARACDLLGTVVACYLPVYPGAQIWFEYSIDGPNPPGAAYFFKMLVNGQLVSSWDCTAKHKYHGKAVYSLHVVDTDIKGEKAIVQKSVAFATVKDSWSPKPKDDCIEIRVHRIEHRRRVRDLTAERPHPSIPRGPTALRVVDNGLIELCRPARRYQYQLLDPRDEPYAAFRFYCRSHEYLERHHIIDVDHSLSPTSQATSASNYFDTLSSPSNLNGVRQPDGRDESPSTPTRNSVHKRLREQSPATPQGLAIFPRSIYSSHNEPSPTIRDSIEDLPSTVPRSPQSPDRPHHQSNQENIPPSPTKTSSPLLPEALQIRKRRSTQVPMAHTTCRPLDSPHKHPVLVPLTRSSTGSPTRFSHRRHRHSNLKLKLDGSHFTLEHDAEPHIHVDKKPSRPLSPFTPGGFLRRLTSTPTFRSTSQLDTVPASTVQTRNKTDIYDADDRISKDSSGNHDQVFQSQESDNTGRTTRLQRGGSLFNSLLGRRGEKRSFTR